MSARSRTPRLRNESTPRSRCDWRLQSLSAYLNNVCLQGEFMADQFDEGFYKRADAHIFLSNDQKQHAAPDMVNASMLFASARFCAFLAAGGFGSGAAMSAGKQEISDYFVEGFRQMLNGHLEDYAGISTPT